MNLRTWTADMRDEFDGLCREAQSEGVSTGERARLMGEKIADAVQAQRMFARDVQRDALERGYLSVFKAWQKSQHGPVAVAHNGDVLNKPRVIGAQRQRDDGSTYHAQTLFDLMTWDELTEKRQNYLRQIKAYRGDVAVMDKLLALRELAPEASTPAEAAEDLGTTLEAWLAEEEAA